MTAEDEIRNLLSLYCQSINQLDEEKFVPLFASNAQFKTRQGVRVGKAGAHDHIEYLKGYWPKNFRTRHTLGTSVIKVHGDTAEAVSDVIVFHSFDDNPWMVGQTGQYIDKFVIEDGAWRFSERVIEADTFYWPPRARGPQ